MTTDTIREGEGSSVTRRLVNRQRVIRLVKLAVSIVVILGLALAVRNGVEQWRGETSKLQASIETLEREIANATEEEQRRAAIRQRERLLASLPTVSNLRWDRIVAAGLVYGIGLVPPAMLLRQALASLGESTSRGVAIAAQLFGHAGKYAPGKALVVVLRVGALGRDGVKPIPATVSVFMETLLMMAVGATVSGLVIGWLPVPGWLVAFAAVGAVAASLPTLPPVLRIVTERVTGWGTMFREGGRSAQAQAWALFFAGWCWSLLSWILIGASFSLLLAAIPTSRELPPTGTLYAIGLASISLAVVAGFASLLPGGVGARELVLTTILAPAVGTGHALLAAIAARLLFLCVEAGLAVAAWYWLRQHAMKAPAVAVPTDREG